MNPIVLDTSVFVSGVFWRHESHLCVKAWLLGEVRLAISDPVFEEYERVFLEVKEEQGFNTDIDSWLDAIRASALWVDPSPLTSPICRDPDDDKFIQVALMASASHIVARDADLTDLTKPFGIEILTPRQFLGRLPRQVWRRLE